MCVPGRTHSGSNSGTRDGVAVTMMSACRHAVFRHRDTNVEFQTTRQQVGREGIGFVTIAHNDMQALQRKDASKGTAFEQRLVACTEDRQCFRFRSRESFCRHRVGSSRSIGIDSRSLDDRADPPALLVDQEDCRAMARPAFAGVVGPERADLEAGQLRRRTRLEREVCSADPTPVRSRPETLSHWEKPPQPAPSGRP